MTSTFLVAVFIVVYLYASTYYFAARTLKNLPPDYDVVRLTMQRKLMMYCTLMSSSLLVCYIPIVIYLMVPKTVQENPWMTAISGEFVAMDNIINPVLILYFVPRIRNAVIGKLEEEKEDYGEWELQDQ
ncbi:hypothetical protein BDR26DRAFT_873399 [Obelidium mucronatum]|nr:hypothetical protein BDR26DRAFT_873399 [Obelidium mucronatum]